MESHLTRYLQEIFHHLLSKAMNDRNQVLEENILYLGIIPNFTFVLAFLIKYIIYFTSNIMKKIFIYFATNLIN